MSTFVFKAVDLAGVKARGEVEADSKQAVSDQLKQRGLIVLDISMKGGSKDIELAFLKRVKAGELAVFSRGGDVFQVRADGSGLRRVTTGPEVDSAPSVAPNGRYVLFERRAKDGAPADLYTTAGRRATRTRADWPTRPMWSGATTWPTSTRA